MNEDGCPAENNGEKDGGSKQHAGKEQLLSIVEEDGEEEVWEEEDDCTGGASGTVEKNECLTMTLEEDGIPTDGNDNVAIIVDEILACSILVELRRSA